MNIISALFMNPEPGTDLEMVDLLESEVDAEIVQQIREAKTTQEAAGLVEKLHKMMLESKVDYTQAVEEWLFTCMRRIGAEEKAGLHNLNSEHNSGEWEG